MKPPKSYLELFAHWGDPVNDEHFAAKFIVEDSHAVGGKMVAIACHRFIAPLFHNVWAELLAAGHLDLISSFDGCFNIRSIRGGSHPSLHSWGLAIDLNAELFPLGSHSRQAPELVQAFARQGFINGADFRFRKDAMHFQFTAPHSI